ncbi:acyl-ACP--UDP-N-acetylglucosamine O-acyltransferase [Pseudomaricurvus hydrocarbonicus]|uniref:acyl-ACP--UDP-N-acetylglucosamine O-acyltransferase n=1 Tax=Pseudomaricurvus hydrocarbonicus TaxID=1470433 RepID=UPI001FB66FC5|nr:acyl-ACP--UDP-N-acetylglucosamine O-acyltransferase [Aestuariicella hydrocarbonica]
MIDPRAIIDPSARLAEGVSVGPWSIIGAGVEIGAGTIIEPHVIVKGPAYIGENNHIFQFSSVGEATPDLKYKGEETCVRIGDNNVIREGVTIHRGTVQDRSETSIGHNNLIMAYAHVGHDSVIGDNCILVNNASLAGHVQVGDWAILGGYSLVHQFCNVGAHCFTGMGSVIGKDVPAYVMVSGNPAAAKSINSEGLRRRGFTKEEIAVINKCFKLVYRRGLTVDEALRELELLAINCEPVNLLIESLKSSTRGIVR